jgi:hypothetical protein
MTLLGFCGKGALFEWKDTKDNRRVGARAGAVRQLPSPVYPSAEAAIVELERTHGKSSLRWLYSDASGEPSMYVLRFERPSKAVGPSDGTSGSMSKPEKTFRPVSRHGTAWIIGSSEGPRLLYRLPELLAAPRSQFLYVAEGEKSADAARQLGLVCTTSPHGCNGASRADWTPVQGRNIVVLPDFDAQGEGYARSVTVEATRAGAASVRVVRLSERWTDLGAGGDIADLVARLEPGDEAKEQLKRDIEALAEATPVELLMVPPEPKEGQDTRQSVAERLVQFAVERYRFIRGTDGELFAVPRHGPNIAISLSSKDPPFRDELAREWRRNNGGTVGISALSDALATLRGEASDGPRERIHLRVAPYQDGVVLDLGTQDGAAVVVTTMGWTIEPVSPVVFKRTALVGELPRPEPGGSLRPLRDLVNVSEETWWLYVGWIVAGLLPDISHPILMVGGHHGTGKTTAARFACGLIDPSEAMVRSQPRDLETWSVSANSAWTTLVDNVSTIPEWWSNALCKAVTGDGLLRRSLYANSDVCVLSFRRVIAITSIDAGALRGDLGERLLVIDTPSIGAEHRRSDAVLNRAYARAHPALLGAVLDILVGVLARQGKVSVPGLPRMADFAEVLAAIDDLLGTNSLGQYLEQAKWVADEVIESDPVGQAIVEFVRLHGEWRGTMSELLQAIAPARADREWPSNGRGLGGRVRHLTPSLEQQGVRISVPPRKDKTRRFGFEWTARTARPPENAPEPIARAGTDHVGSGEAAPAAESLRVEAAAHDGRAVGTAPTTDRPSDRPTETDPGDVGTRGSGGRAVRAVVPELPPLAPASSHGGPHGAPPPRDQPPGEGPEAEPGAPPEGGGGSESLQVFAGTGRGTAIFSPPGFV